MEEQKKAPESEPTHILTEKQEGFCHEYLKDKNATKAAIRAGYSPETARQGAAQVLSNIYIRARVNELIKEQLNRLKLNADLVLKELAKSATVDIADAYNQDNTLKSIHDMPEPLRKAIAEITTEELFEGRGEDRKLIGYTKKIRLWDKDRALELLGKHMKLFTDITEIPGLSSLAEDIKQARQRAKNAGNPHKRIRS